MSFIYGSFEFSLSLSQEARTYYNAPLYTESSVNAWLAMVEEESECPAQSPHLNPTEHLCDVLEHRLNPRTPRST